MTKEKTEQGQDSIHNLYLMIGEMKGQIDGLKERVTTLEQRDVGQGTSGSNDTREDADAILAGLTPRQHATLQMIINGKSTPQIASRLGVTESTVKVHIRLIAKKCGVRLRRQIIALLKPAYSKMGSQRYLTLSGGLPKNWDVRWGAGTQEFDYLVRHEGDKGED